MSSACLEQNRVIAMWVNKGVKERAINCLQAAPFHRKHFDCLNKEFALFVARCEKNV